MNSGQKTYRAFVLRSFEEHHFDITRTLCWCQRHHYKLSEPERMAIRDLSEREKNAVISEILIGHC